MRAYKPPAPVNMTSEEARAEEAQRLLLGENAHAPFMDWHNICRETGPDYRKGPMFTIQAGHLELNWSGKGRLRCGLCNWAAELGSAMRWVMVNGIGVSGSVCPGGNFFICSHCDAPIDEVLRKRSVKYERQQAAKQRRKAKI